MVKLNLNNVDSGELKYEVFKFPDGQQDLKIILKNMITPKSVIIESRFNNFTDLELILCATKALRNMGFKEITLWVPYLLGSRSDRLFEYGGTSYLRDIIAPILNAQNYEKVISYDVHSDVAEACINNFKSINSNSMVLNYIDNFLPNKEITLVSPDAGSLKKVWSLLKYLKDCDAMVSDDIIIASKHRDVKTGNITHTNVPLNNGEHTNNVFLIFDDICDGGRTFIEIAKVIKNIRPNSELYLGVTHGIFSKGLDELKEYFNGVFSTNSYSTKENDGFLRQYDVFNHPILTSKNFVK